MSEQATPEDDAVTTSGQPGTEDTEGHFARAEEQPGYARADEQPSARAAQEDEDDTEGFARG
jgi:hypothetical protein